MIRTIPNVVVIATLLIQCVTGSALANGQPRIVDGLDIDISVLPATVALLRNDVFEQNDSFYQSRFCGGTLVDSTWVLTAAHCLFDPDGNSLQPSDISILAGTTDLNSPVTSATPVLGIFKHPGYTDIVSGDDIALLQLSEPAPGIGIRMNDVQLAANDEVFIAGWGSFINPLPDNSGGNFPNILQGAIIPILSTSDCVALGGDYQMVNVDTQICAGYIDGGADSCLGDNGGPLYNTTEDEQLLLAGITSRVDGCAVANQPGIYTNVAAYKDWIDAIVGAVPAVTQNSAAVMNDLVNRSFTGGGASLILVPLLLLFFRFKRRKLSTFINLLGRKK